MLVIDISVSGMSDNWDVVPAICKRKKMHYRRQLNLSFPCVCGGGGGWGWEIERENTNEQLTYPPAFPSTTYVNRPFLL